jgi:hypothetical protein
MNIPDFFRYLYRAEKIEDVSTAIKSFEKTNFGHISWVPFGGRENNRGAIEISTDPGRSIVERITNGIDAVLEAEYIRHNGIPQCLSPKAAAIAWLNVPHHGLYELDQSERRNLANRVSVKILPGEGKSNRVVVINDRGTGLFPDEMPTTILSLNESNKWQKHYLVGVFGQGGSSTLAVSKFTFIASRNINCSKVGFTIIKYEDLPPDLFKTGHYVYLVFDNKILSLEIEERDFPIGTDVKHFGYDLSGYGSPLGPNSVYGLLNQVLFDPVIPIWLDDRVHVYRRVIKGSRNALNGAVDEGDENRRGPTLSHNVTMYHTGIAEYGRIGIEYWVLEAPTTEKKNPIQAFVNPRKPIVLTINGQNHAELGISLIRKDADLPYLSQRLICHIDCNSLTPSAKRLLFTSTREQVRGGIILDLIQDEMIKALKSDDELARLNAEAKAQSVRARDESEVQQMKREVSRLLRIQGLNITDGTGGVKSGSTERSGRVTQPRTSHPVPKPIELKEPPTFIRIVWDGEKEITFYPGQRRYIRIETDANSNYHKPENPSESKINIIVADGPIAPSGTTPLQGGRMRVIMEANTSANPGDIGVLRVELTRINMTSLSDERLFEIIKTPPIKPTRSQTTIPDFEVRAVSGPEDQLWTILGWPDDVRTIASSANSEKDKLVIFYSEVFSNYYEQRKAFERRDIVLANSFTKRYEIWLAVHSLLLFQDQQDMMQDVSGKDNYFLVSDNSEAIEEYERQERCRIAKLSSLIAAREVLENVQKAEIE